MDQQCKDIVFILKGNQIIRKPVRIYRNFNAAKQFRYGLRQPVKIHTDIIHQVFGSRSFCPIRTAAVVSHRIRIIYRCIFCQRVAVIPLLHHGEITAMLFTQRLDFLFGKAHISGKFPWINHGKFFEIRYCRLRSVFLDRKDAGHICSGKYACRRTASFKQGAQEFQILLLYFRRFPDGHVPFINYGNKFIAGQLCRVHQCRGKRFIHPESRIGIRQFLRHLASDKRKHPLAAGFSQNIGHIQIDHIVSVQMFLV